MPTTVLGEGAFGVAIKIKDSRYGESAIKIIPIWDTSSKLTEFEIGQKVSHRNLLQLYGCRKDNDLQRYPKKIRKRLKEKWVQRNVVSTPLNYFHIHMELCNAGSLQDWIVSPENRSRNLVTADKLFSQILEAVAVLHREEIVHGDLKPQNIFLQKISNSHTIVKVGDFGDSFYEKVGPHRQPFGTVEYKENTKRGNNEPITSKYDIYSLGLIYAILFMGSFLSFDKDFVHSNETRKNALHNLLKSIRNCGSSRLIKETHPGRENFVRQLIADEERPDVSHAIKQFSEMVKETNLSLMLSSVPGKNPLFQGRREILQEINESSSKYILLYGLTGTGKKTIAAEYLHSKSESHEFQEIVWFNCNSEQNLKKEYRRIHAEKNLRGPFSTLTVLNWLNSQPRLAIVYVNLPHFSKIRYLIATNRKCGLVICTSRINSDEWPEYFKKIKVNLLPETDCSNLIYKAVTIVNKQNETLAKKKIDDFKFACMFLSNHLGYSTTAIAQSFVYLRNKNGVTAIIDANSICNYVKYCQETKYEVKQMQHDVIKLRKLDIDSIYKTLVSTILQLSAVNLIAFKWLKICSYLECEDIPEFMFDNFLEKNDAVKLKNETLAHLKYYSLIEYHCSNKGTFAVSRIVQRVVQMYFGSFFEETLENINRALSIRHLNGMGTTRIYWDKTYRIRTLKPHYQTILNHVNEYKNRLLSRSPNLLTYCIPSHKKERNLQKIEFSMQKALRHSYRSQALHEDEVKAVDKILTLKETLFGNNHLIRGTSLLTKAKKMLSSVTASKHTDKDKVDCLVNVLNEAEKVLKECYNRNQNQIEIYQCCLYQARCCALFKEQWYNHSDGKKKIEARGYLNKALEILVNAVNRKKNVLVPLVTTLKLIAENYSYSNDFEMMEKYLLVAFEFSLLNKIDEEKLRMLHEIDNYKVTDELFENTLEKWHCDPSGAYIVLKTFGRCYKRQKSPKKELFVANIHEQCKVKVNRLGAAYHPNFGKFHSDSPIKATKRILESLPPLEERKKENDNNALLAEAQSKICLAKLLKGQQNIKEAIKYLNEGLDIYLQHRNNNDLSVAFVYENLGECYTRIRERENACQMYEKCYRILKSDQVMNKETNIKFANIIQKYAKQLPIEQFQEKISLLEECLPILISYSGRNHNAVAFVNEKIGSLYFKMGNFKQAIISLKEALKTYDNKLPQGNQNRVSCLEKLYQTCEKLWDARDEAETFKMRYDLEVAAQNDGKENIVEKSKLLKKTKRKKLICNDNRAKSIMNGTFY